MTNTMQDIRETVRQTPYLLIDPDEDTARLLSHDEALRRLTDGSSPVALIVDLGRCLAAFARLTAGRDEYDISDLEKITAAKKSTINQWVRLGLVEPSVRPAHGQGRYSTRLFSRADAFRAGLIASLRRHGVALPMIRRVLRLLTTARVEA